MLITGIPSFQIVQADIKNKDYELSFSNNKTRNDTYILKIFLRKDENNYKIKLSLISDVLSYPALEMSWVFDSDRYDQATRVYHRICNEVDDIKTEYDFSKMPSSIIAAKVREAVKPISMSNIEKTHIPFIDEAQKLSGVSDWRYSLYGNKYPDISTKEKHIILKYEGNQKSDLIERKIYNDRDKY